MKKNIPKSVRQIIIPTFDIKSSTFLPILSTIKADKRVAATFKDPRMIVERSGEMNAPAVLKYSH